MHIISHTPRGGATVLPPPEPGQPMGTRGTVTPSPDISIFKLGSSV